MSESQVWCLRDYFRTFLGSWSVCFLVQHGAVGLCVFLLVNTTIEGLGVGWIGHAGLIGERCEAVTYHTFTSTVLAQLTYRGLHSSLIVPPDSLGLGQGGRKFQTHFSGETP